MEKIKASDQICFVNLIFKNGCTDSIAVASSKEHLWEHIAKKLDKYGKGIKNDILTFNGIHGYGYVELSTVAKIEISEIDKGPMVLVKSKLNKDLEL